MNSVELGILVSLAGLMAVITAGLVKWASEARTATSAVVVLFLLGMMIAMLAGALFYFLSPSQSRLVVGLWLASGTMSVLVFPVLAVFLREARERLAEGASHRPKPLQRRQLFAVTILGLVVLNEFLMGWTFQLAAATLRPADAASWGQLLALGVNSPWFLFPMAVEMALTTYLLRALLPTQAMAVFGVQAAMMVFSPPAFSFAGWVVVSVTVGSGLMFGVFAYPVLLIYRRAELSLAFVRYLIVLLPIFGLMLAGTIVWVLYAIGWPFALSVLLQMAAFFDVIVLSDRFVASTGGPPTARPAPS